VKYLGPEPCEHGRFEPRVRRLSNGSLHVWMQCLSCFAPVGTAQGKAKYDLERLEPFDEMARERSVVEQKGNPTPWNGDFWKWYEEYLSSAVWRAKRDAVVHRDGYLCQACLQADAAQAHHTTYRHVGREPLFELIAVCAECHDRITAMDRGQERDDTAPW
jgi:hypothetical protein